MAVRLIFVHGINQDPQGKDALLAKWRNLLIDNATDPRLFENVDARMAFYADILGNAGSSQQAVGMGAVAMGQGLPSRDEIGFLGSAMGQMARAAAVSDHDIQVGADTPGELVIVAQSSALGRLLVGSLAALERRAPSAGVLGVRVLRQAWIYLSQPLTQHQIDERVKGELIDAIRSGDTPIVVSHSLGTVISFKLLRDLVTDPDLAPILSDGRRQIPLLVTMGSPLSIAAVRDRIGLPRGRPAIVTRWANFYDRGDLVSLGEGLTATTFGPDIENYGDVNNQTRNAHSIEGYLNHENVVASLEKAIEISGG